MLNTESLILMTGLIYLVFLLRHLSHKRTLEEHFIFTVFFVYLAGVVNVTFFPFPIQQSLMIAMQNQPWHPAIVDLIPLRSIYLIITRDQWSSIVHGIGGNIILFFPLGCLLPLMISRLNSRKAMTIGVGVSIGVELLQGFFNLLLGYEYRQPGIDQVILNTIGFWEGYTLVQRVSAKLPLPTYYGAKPTEIRRIESTD